MWEQFKAKWKSKSYIWLFHQRKGKGNKIEIKVGFRVIKQKQN